MSRIDEIVNISITKDTTGAKRKSFGTPLILGSNLESGKLAFFADEMAVADAVTGGTGSEEYKFAVVFFAQNPSVEKIAIGLYDSANGSVGDALDEIEAVSSEWYGLVSTYSDATTILGISAWIETKEKVYIAQTSESEVIDESAGVDTTSVAFLLKELKYERTMLVYGTDRTVQYTDAGICGRIMPLDAGTYTAKFKTLRATPKDSLSSTQSMNAREKNCNTYEEIGGRIVFREGITPSGEFLDTIIFVDWLKSTMSEDVYATLAKALKVPYTDKGIQTIASSMENSLSIGLSRGAISETLFDNDNVQIGGYVIQVPKKSETSADDRANRVLRDVTFTAWLSGAIHKVYIKGTVTI